VELVGRREDHLLEGLGIFDLAGERALGAAQQRGEHLTGLVGAIVDRLLPEDHQAGVLFARDALEELGHGERLDLGIGLDQDRTVCAHRELRSTE
jgi:hypothetical protein